MEREAVLVALDVGTNKVVALIGEVARDGTVTVIGKGAQASSGLKKGVVVNIEQTVGSISQAREVTVEDVERATEVARAVSIPSNRQILHVLPRGYVVDGQEGVKDPLGMSAVRLEVETHIVHASATAVQNLSKCVQRADVRIDELVCASLASADAVLTDTEKELGVAVADFGAGTIDLALFLDGSAFHTAVLPLGGNNVTNDIAIGLKTSLAAAEDLKINYGTADPNGVGEDDAVDVQGIGEGDATTASRRELAEIIEARMREVFEKIGAEIERAGHTGMLPAGLVLTGGASQLAGSARLGREVLGMPVRVAGPTGVSGLTDHLLTPAYSTSLGLLMWGAETVHGFEPRYDSAPAPGMLNRMREWARGLLP